MYTEITHWPLFWESVIWFYMFYKIMFTWIIYNKVKISKIVWWKFTVEYSWDEPLHIWQSISHDWACMTIDWLTETWYTFFTMEESFWKTNFWSKKIGDFFNIEFSVTPQSKLDWHFVTWHIDCIGFISNSLKQEDWSTHLTFTFDEKFDTLIVPKWSIVINWVSLTVWTDVSKGQASVWIIPHTLTETNLSELKINDTINIEFDILAKYVTQFWRPSSK